MSIDGSVPAGKSRRKVAIALVLVGALSVSLVAESKAQRFGGGGFGGGAMRSPGNFSPNTGSFNRIPGNDGPRYPGGGMGRHYPGPGITVLPGGYGPRGPGNVVVVDDDDGLPPHRRKPKHLKQTKQQKQKPQQQNQLVQRGGFNVPAAGERRLIPNEILLNVAAEM